MPQHDDGKEAKGCGLPPGTTWALVLVVLWMMLVVPAYQRWRYGKPPPPEQSQGQPRPAPGEDESQPGRIEGEGRGESEASGEADPAAVLVPGRSAAGGPAEKAPEIADPGPEGAASGQGPGPDQAAREELRPEDGLEPEAEPETIEIETDELIVELTTLGASVERAALRSFHFTPNGTEPLRILMPLRGARGEGNSFILRPVVDIEGKRQGVDLSGVVWKLEEDSGGFDRKDERRVTFVTTRGGVAYRKRFVFHKQGHVLGLEIEARNDTRSRKTVEFDLVGPNGIVPDDFAGGRKYAGMETILGAREGPEEKLNIQRISFKKAAGGDLTKRGLSMALNEWVAVRNRYFTAICQADDQAAVRALYAEAVEPSVPLRGAVTFESGTTEVLGAGTRFLDEVRPGDLVRLDADRTWYEVMAVYGDTRLILATTYEGASPPPRGLDVRRTRPTGGPASRWRRDPLLKQPNVAGVMRVSFGGLEPGGSGSARFRVYLGPMQGDMLAEAGGERGWEKVIAFGWFGSISRLLLGFLKVLHGFTRLFGGILGGYGLAILLLTLAVKGVMFPVMRRSIVSMHKMQRLQPEVAAIKKRYAKDKSAETQRKMQMEIMGLYKKKKVSMFGGCLPMFIQLPMFFALFGMLRNAFELRQEPYLWIRDLTQCEHLIDFGVTIPIIGWTGLNLLPFVYLALTLLQQRLQPKPADPQAEQQQKMMKYMMMIFPLILYNMPSGLILYFTFSNGFGILEQWIIRRRLDEGAGPPSGPGNGGAPGAGSVDVKPVGAAGPKDPTRKTAWDRQDERQTRKAEKRKKKREQRDRRSEKGPGGPG